MVVKEALVRRQISQAGRDDGVEGGFTLLEVLCVVAILAFLASMMLPTFTRGTSRPQLESYAVATAALLKADRNAAIRRRLQTATVIDAPARTIRSEATGRLVRVPNDID